jgi:hypothetical protein
MDFSSLNTYLNNPNYQQGGGINLFGSSSSPAIAAANPGGGFFGNNSGFGFNANTLNFGLGALSTIGNLYGAFQANKLAKDQFNFQKQFAQDNLANQIKSYNTTLSDRARSRGVVEGQTQDQVNQYIDQNSL